MKEIKLYIDNDENVFTKCGICIGNIVGYKYEFIENDFNIDELIKLKNAGFETDEILKMKAGFTK